MAEIPNIGVLVDAAANIEWLEPRIRGVLALSGELRRLGGIANAVRETETRLAAARAEEASLAAERQRQRAEHDAAITAILTEAAAEAQRRLSAADGAVAARHAAADIEIAEQRADAEREIAKAKAEAETAIAPAKADVEQAKAEATRINLEKDAELQILQERIDLAGEAFAKVVAEGIAARGDRDALVAECETLQVEKARIERLIADLKAKF